MRRGLRSSRHAVDHRRYTAAADQPE